MPEVVLRHHDLPNQPLVIDVPVGTYVPDQYRDSGWDIDTDTSVADALVEVEAVRVRGLEKADQNAAEFVPQFAPKQQPADAPQPASFDQPTPATTPESAPAPAPEL